MSAKDQRKYVMTPQFRTALIRAIKNLEPDFEIEFVDSKSGIAFRMKDSKGCFRSQIVNIYVDRGDALQNSKLRSRLNAAGFPSVFLK